MDQATFSHLAEGMRLAAYRSARSVGCSDEDARDVASETMITLWMMRERLEPVTCVAYARAAGRNKALNFRRDVDQPLIRIDDYDAFAPPAHTAPSPEDSLISAEDVEWFFQRVEQLPTTQQAILRLRQVDMLDKSEIAQRLGIPVTSVATLLSRARRTMYNAIKERMKK